MIELTPFAPLNVILLGVLNPVAAIIAFVMGRHADQWGKCVLAGFVGALAGAIVLWFAVRIGVIPARGLGGETGVFVVSFIAGTIWASLGFFAFRKASASQATSVADDADT
ncbi:MAG: hypothetical protein AAGJ53_08570 [Pseudomonadota bacterium]